MNKDEFERLEALHKESLDRFLAEREKLNKGAGELLYDALWVLDGADYLTKVLMRAAFIAAFSPAAFVTIAGIVEVFR